MGNFPACLSGRYSMIHDMGSEEGDVDQKIGELGRSSGGGSIKVVRVTDGKVFGYKTARSGSTDDDDDDMDDPQYVQRLRAKDVVSMVQDADKGRLLYELFDQSSYISCMASTPYISNSGIENEKKKKKTKEDKTKGKGTYDSKPLHPETILKVSQVYYLRPACAATSGNSARHISSNISSCPASGRTAAAITRAATTKKKKVRFSDQVVFIEPPPPSSSEYYNHHHPHSQLDCVFLPTQRVSALPNLAATAPLSELGNTAQAQNKVARHDDDGRGGDGPPIDECQVATKGSDVVRVKLLLSKRELCDLIAATAQQQHHHSQLMASADVFTEKSVAPLLPPHLAENQLLTSPQPPSLLSPTNKLIHIVS